MPIDFYVFRGNEADDRHCFQATFGMAWQALLGESLSLDQAEVLTGFVAGQSTWPFKGMLSAAEAGLFVENLEDFDVEGFIESPIAELTRQFGGDRVAAQRVVERSAAADQVALVQACVAHPRIAFKRTAPSIADLRARVEVPGAISICNVNYRALVGQPGYNGHFVLVKSVDKQEVVLDNPGLPAIANQQVSLQRFGQAWSPEPTMANVITFSREPLPSNP